jgi:hypothetical protein
MNLNWKKVVLFTMVSVVAPGLSHWMTGVTTGQPIPFTVGNIIVPALPGLIATLSALFSNPWAHK